MFKKLEEDNNNVIFAAEESPEEECSCVCRKSSEISKEETPEVDQLAVFMPTHFDING
ncbi:MAG: hypothetical protein KOO60_08575 [Gemmatimonadales bacterium]|nr:hypothetical protein [Gemmatimonadales bacterium]